VLDAVDRRENDDLGLPIDPEDGRDGLEAFFRVAGIQDENVG
jgi:hypothetical protein